MQHTEQIERPTRTPKSPVRPALVAMALMVGTILIPLRVAEAQSLSVANYSFLLTSAATHASNSSEMSPLSGPKAQALIAFGQARLGCPLSVQSSQTTAGTVSVTPPQSARSFSLAFRVTVATLSGVGRDGHSTAALIVCDYPSSVPGLSSVRLVTREFSNQYPGAGAWSPYEWIQTPDGKIDETKTRKTSDNYPLYRGSLKLLEKYLPGQQAALRQYLNTSARSPLGQSVAATLNVNSSSPAGSANTRYLTLATAMLVSPALSDDNGPGAVDARLPNGDLKVVRGDPAWLVTVKEAIVSGIKSALVAGAKELLQYIWTLF